jgi:hypothetical protein
MFMITGLQIQAFRVTGEAKYANLAASTMVKYLDKLQQPAAPSTTTRTWRCVGVAATAG